MKLVGFFLPFFGIVLLGAEAAPGDLDPTFGTGGTLVSSYGGVMSAIYHGWGDIALQSDGKMVLLGYVTGGLAGSDLVLSRYNADGSKDPSFSSGGGYPITYYNYGNALAIQDDGKIVVGGAVEYGNLPYPTGGSRDFALYRHNTDGSRDTTFGTNGAVVTAVSTNDDGGSCVALQSDGKIVVAGYSRFTSTGPTSITVLRYNPNGSLDGTFGSSGVVKTSFGSGSAYATSVIVQSDGKIVVSGYADASSNNSDFAIIRYNADGSLDTSFGGTGTIITPIGSGNDRSSEMMAQADGKIVLVGSTLRGSTTYYDIAMARYNLDGSLDGSFGGTGIVTTGLGFDDARASDLAIQGDGRIYIAGNAYQQNSGAGSNFLLASFNSDGSSDLSFGLAGKVTTRLGALQTSGASCLALQADGNIVLGGMARNWSTNSDFALARYIGVPEPSSALFVLAGCVFLVLRSRSQSERSALGTQWRRRKLRFPFPAPARVARGRQADRVETPVSRRGLAFPKHPAGA